MERRSNQGSENQSGVSRYITQNSENIRSTANRPVNRPVNNNSLFRLPPNIYFDEPSSPPGFTQIHQQNSQNLRNIITSYENEMRLQRLIESERAQREEGYSEDETSEVGLTRSQRRNLEYNLARANLTNNQRENVRQSFRQAIERQAVQRAMETSFLKDLLILFNEWRKDNGLVQIETDRTGTYTTYDFIEDFASEPSITHEFLLELERKFIQTLTGNPNTNERHLSALRSSIEPLIYDRLATIDLLRLHFQQLHRNTPGQRRLRNIRKMSGTFNWFETYGGRPLSNLENASDSSSSNRYPIHSQARNMANRANSSHVRPSFSSHSLGRLNDQDSTHDVFRGNNFGISPNNSRQHSAGEDNARSVNRLSVSRSGFPSATAIEDNRGSSESVQSLSHPETFTTTAESVSYTDFQRQHENEIRSKRSRPYVPDFNSRPYSDRNEDDPVF